MSQLYQMQQAAALRAVIQPIQPDSCGRQSSIMETSQTLAVAINDLTSLVDDLHRRLEPIMRPPEPEPGTQSEAGKPPATAPLAELLKDKTRSVRSVCYRLEYIIGHLEV